MQRLSVLHDVGGFCRPLEGWVTGIPQAAANTHAHIIRSDCISHAACLPRAGEPEHSRQAGKLVLGSASVTDAEGLPTAGALSAAISQGAAYPDPGSNPNPGSTDPTSELQGQPGPAYVQHGASWTGVWVGNGLVKCLNDSALPVLALCSKRWHDC